jgi:hypothetical protein
VLWAEKAEIVVCPLLSRHRDLGTDRRRQVTGVVKTPEAPATLESYKVADGSIVCANKGKRIRPGGLRQRTTDCPGVRHNRHQLVWMFFNDAIEPSGYPRVQLSITFGAGNFSPLLVFMHFNNSGVILMRLYPKEATFPISKVNFP